MKARKLIVAVFGLALCFSLPSVTGATFDFSAAPILIPDGDGVGVLNSQGISSPFNSITHLSVSLNLAGQFLGSGFNGDLYVTLVHNDRIVVLLNRPGVVSSGDIGYADSGLNVTFDQSSTANIHSYRSSLLSGPATPLLGTLTGTWAPDGRLVDPASVTDAIAPATSLDQFNGLDPNGTWNLFLADVDTGGISQLVSWSLNIDGTTSIPDAFSTIALLLAGVSFIAFFSTNAQQLLSRPVRNLCESGRRRK